MASSHKSLLLGGFQIKLLKTLLYSLPFFPLHLAPGCKPTLRFNKGNKTTVLKSVSGDAWELGQVETEGEREQWDQTRKCG